MRPSTSFGANHVDFGGMMPPASATAMTSLICVGYSATAAEVGEQSVVAENAHVAHGEDDVQEVFMTSVRRRPLPPSRECDARGGRRTMVAVGDVKASHRVECVRQTLDGHWVAYHPQRMAHFVGICR